MTWRYLALVRKTEDSDYWIDAPDIPGCVASGNTLNEAKYNYAAALHLHIRRLEQPGSEIPPPRSREAVLCAEDDGYLYAYFVEIRVPLHE